MILFVKEYNIMMVAQLIATKNPWKSKKVPLNPYMFTITTILKVEQSTTLTLTSSWPFNYFKSHYESYESEYDSEDSNAECFYKNDYPDAESSIGEYSDEELEVLMNATKHMRVWDSEEYTDEEYGFSSGDEDGFTKYKKRVLKELYGEDANSSEEKEEDQEEEE